MKARDLLLTLPMTPDPGTPETPRTPASVRMAEDVRITRGYERVREGRKKSIINYLANGIANWMSEHSNEPPPNNEVEAMARRAMEKERNDDAELVADERELRRQHTIFRGAKRHDRRSTIIGGGFQWLHGSESREIGVNPIVKKPQIQHRDMDSAIGSEQIRLDRRN